MKKKIFVTAYVLMLERATIDIANDRSTWFRWVLMLLLSIVKFDKHSFSFHFQDYRIQLEYLKSSSFFYIYFYLNKKNTNENASRFIEQILFVATWFYIRFLSVAVFCSTLLSFDVVPQIFFYLTWIPFFRYDSE